MIILKSQLGRSETSARNVVEITAILSLVLSRTNPRGAGQGGVIRGGGGGREGGRREEVGRKSGGGRAEGGGEGVEGGERGWKAGERGGSRGEESWTLSTLSPDTRRILKWYMISDESAGFRSRLPQRVDQDQRIGYWQNTASFMQCPRNS